MTWAVVPAAGRGTRVGAGIPKQYLPIAGKPLIEHTLLRLLTHPRVDGVVVCLAPGDAHWPGWTTLHGKPVLRCAGGGQRADSVLAGLRALPATVAADDCVLVHDAARPCLRHADLQRLLELGQAHAVGAILAAPLRDTLKRGDDAAQIVGSVPRERLWRAFTPQLFRRGALTEALASAAAASGAVVTDEAMAMERRGLLPLLVEGAEDNIKVTTAADLALAAFILSTLPADPATLA